VHRANADKHWASTLGNRFEEQVDELLQGAFSEDAVDSKIDTWSEQIAGAVADQARAEIRATEDGVLSPQRWADAIAGLRETLRYLRDNRGYAYP
jgi:hypothetical protein